MGQILKLRIHLTNKRLQVLAPALLVVAGIIFAGCTKTEEAKPESKPDAFSTSANAKAESPYARLFILGIDGFSWDVANKLIVEGRLPNIKKLKTESAWGTLKSIKPMWSPLLWTTIATGKTPEEHGIDAFQLKDPMTGELIPPLSRLRRTPALWNIFSRFDRTVYTINWWATSPPENINGIVISDLFSPTPNRDEIYPKSDFEALNKAVSPPTNEGYRQFIKQYIDSDPEGLLAIRNEMYMAEPFSVLEGCWFRDKNVMDNTHYILSKKPFPDVFFNYIQSADCVGHYFMGYGTRWGSRARWVPDIKTNNRLGDIYPGFYEWIDEYVGKTISLLPPDAMLVIMSDHGERFWDDGLFAPKINKFLESWGYLQKDAAGNVDMANTLISDVSPDPMNAERHLFINWETLSELERSEPRKTEFRKEIFEKLKLRFSEVSSDEKPIFSDIRMPEKIDEPDIIISVLEDNIGEDIKIGDESYPSSDFVKTIVWTATHKPNGAILFHGPGVRKGYKLPVQSIIDVTRTLMFLQGIPCGSDMQGEVMRLPWSDKALMEKPEQCIDSYSLNGQVAAAEYKPSQKQEEQLERLRALGYIQ